MRCQRRTAREFTSGSKIQTQAAMDFWMQSSYLSSLQMELPGSEPVFHGSLNILISDISVVCNKDNCQLETAHPKNIAMFGSGKKVRRLALAPSVWQDTSNNQGILTKIKNSKKITSSVHMCIVRSLTWKKTAVLKYNFKILEILLQNWE